MSRRWIAMLRAINVGTANRVTAARLAEIVSGAGATDLTAYLQSGNLFFAAPGTREEIATAIEGALADAGFRRAEVMIRTAAELRALVDRRPFEGVDQETHRCSVTFFRSPPPVMPTERLAAAQLDVRFVDDLHLCVAAAKDGPVSGGATSALLDKAWKVPSTTRWWNVVEAITERAEACER